MLCAIMARHRRSHQHVIFDAQHASIVFLDETDMTSPAARAMRAPTTARLRAILVQAIACMLFAAAILLSLRIVPAGGEPSLRENVEIHRARITAALVLAGIAVSLVAWLAMRRNLFRRPR
jgi:hypothetical protein